MLTPLPRFFPTKILMVDDNERFLNLVAPFFTDLPFTYKLYTDQFEALDFLNNSNSNVFLKKHYLEALPDEEFDFKRIHLRVPDIHMEIYNPNRFSHVSTIVIDYEMPGLHGLEFCQQIKDKNIQKIMLTGAASHSLAIKAFNDGLITQFIRKDNLNFIEHLISALTQAQYTYFQKESQPFIDFLSANQETPTPLKDPLFKKLFVEVVENENIVEFYLLDSNGSMLFLDDNGQPSRLVVMSHSELNALAEIADFEKASPSLIQAIRSQDYILCFSSLKGPLPPVEEWERYLQPAKRLPSESSYSYAYMMGTNFLDFQGVKSFKSYKQKILSC